MAVTLCSCSQAKSREYYSKHHDERSKMINECVVANKPIGTTEDCKNALASANDDV